MRVHRVLLCTGHYVDGRKCIRKTLVDAADLACCSVYYAKVAVPVFDSEDG